MIEQVSQSVYARTISSPAATAATTTTAPSSLPSLYHSSPRPFMLCAHAPPLSLCLSVSLWSPCWASSCILLSECTIGRRP